MDRRPDLGGEAGGPCPTTEAAPRYLMEPPNCGTMKWVQGAAQADRTRRLLTMMMSEISGGRVELSLSAEVLGLGTGFKESHNVLK